jgi:hypothetical protein
MGTVAAMAWLVVFAMNLSTGLEQVVSFAANADPFHQSGNQINFAPGEFWPAT